MEKPIKTAGYAFTLVKLTIPLVFFSGCSFFQKHTFSEGPRDGASGRLIGDSLGDKALGPNEALLAEVRAITTDKAPAGLRADPDTYVRQLLRDHRPEGETIAREIGRVEKYRMLLGGASEDFKVAPAKSFDATSLLAFEKVAEEICRGLVAPSESDHPGWTSILPERVNKVEENLRFLAQRFLGISSDRIPEEILTALSELVEADRAGGSYAESDYISACVALSLDAQSLLF